MLTTDPRNDLRVATVVVLLILASYQSADSSTITSKINYSTTATIASSGISGSPVVIFQGVDNGTTSAGSSIELGQFSIHFPPGGSTTSYHNTPFIVTLQFETASDNHLLFDNKPILLYGLLNGTATGADASRLTASFNPLEGEIYNGDSFRWFYSRSFQINSMPFHLGLQDPTTSLGLPSDGITPIRGTIEGDSVPEPTTFSIVLTAIIGWGILRKRTGSRKAT